MRLRSRPSYLVTERISAAEGEYEQVSYSLKRRRAGEKGTDAPSGQTNVLQTARPEMHIHRVSIGEKVKAAVTR